MYTSFQKYFNMGNITPVNILYIYSVPVEQITELYPHKLQKEGVYENCGGFVLQKFKEQCMI